MQSIRVCSQCRREAKDCRAEFCLLFVPDQSLEDGPEALIHVAERLARAGRLAVLVDGGLAMSVAIVSMWKIKKMEKRLDHT